MNIIQAIHDSKLFRPFLADRDDRLGSWVNWMALLRALYGLPIPEARREVVSQCTGRKVDLLPSDGFDTALFLTGRRSGKSRSAAILGAHEAILAGHEMKLSVGEQGIVAVVAPTKKQSGIVKGYLRSIFKVPLLQREVIGETKDGFDLRSGVKIDILAGDWRTIRGYTLLAAIVDEAAFLGLDDESKVKSDTELMRAIKPALATVGGKLIAITTPYARKGWCWKTYQKNFGNDEGKTLVVNCASRTLNPTLPQSVVEEALAEDLAAAKAEYLGEFRDDVAEFLPRSVIEKCVVEGRRELLPERGVRYSAFADLSGGRVDAAALAISHRAGRTAILDFCKVWKPPFSPQDVIRQMVVHARRFNATRVVGDNYAAEFVADGFRSCGMAYVKSELVRSALYLELLPRLCSGEVQLLDNDLLINQLAALERRTRSGGKDIVDHPPGTHDDLANASAGAIYSVSQQLTVGAI